MVTCAGCPSAGAGPPHRTFGQRTGIQRSSAETTIYDSGGAPYGTPPLLRSHEPYATGASSSKKPRVLFGSTGMPGPIVVVMVAFLT